MKCTLCEGLTSKLADRVRARAGHRSVAAGPNGEESRGDQRSIRAGDGGRIDLEVFRELAHRGYWGAGGEGA